jgi:hypothetical protein
MLTSERSKKPARVEQPTYCPIPKVWIPPKWSKTPPIEKIKFDKPFAKIPMAHDSRARAGRVRSVRIDQHMTFGRAGLIPYSVTREGDTLYFFNVFHGNDRGKVELNMSDFGGRVESVESFMAAATGETLEESLGVFNFENLESEVFSISEAIYAMDRSLIVILVPIKFSYSPVEITKMFNKRMAEFKLLKGKVSRDKLLPSIPGFKRPKLNLHDAIDMTDIMKPDNSPVRISRVNIDESKDILYITKEDLRKVIAGDSVPLPQELAEAVEFRYEFYPSLYEVIATRLKETSALED